MPQQLKVTLIKSLIDQKPCHKKAAQAMGLRRISKTRIYDDSPNVRGMIRVIRHLVKVEEL
jgi:large subunit ribosomal protein L30